MLVGHGARANPFENNLNVVADSADKSRQGRRVSSPVATKKKSF